MCGIYGVYGVRNEALAEKLQQDMFSRGPDSRGIYSEGAVSLGMNRLHLRGDLTTKVPFMVDGKVVCYNGEIYGHLLEDLSYVDNALGGVEEVRFMHSHMESGQLDGMYAIAEYDPKNESLKLARDRFGIKPLFYKLENNKLVFSSCVRSFFRNSTGLKPQLDPQVLFDIFTYGYSLNGNTAFKGIKELLPGYSLNLSPTQCDLSEAVAKCRANPQNASEALRKCLRQSLQGCIKGEYKIGLAISGGVDSTILAHELNAMGVKGIETFSVYLAETDDGVKKLSQLDFSGNDAWKTWKHHYVEITKENFKEYMLESIGQFGYPTDMHSLPLYTALAKIVAQRKIRVLLTGEGADEYFMGYSKYRSYSGKPLVSDYYLSSKKGEFIRTMFERSLVEDGMARGNAFESGPFWSQIRSIEIKGRLQKLLLRTDVILMEHEIEGRTPFLHGGVPEIALSQSTKSLKGKYGKQLLRETFKDTIKDLDAKEKKRFKASEQLFWEVFNDPQIKAMVREPIEIAGINLSDEIVDAIYEAYQQGDQSDLSELLFLILTTKLSIKNYNGTV